MKWPFQKKEKTGKNWIIIRNSTDPNNVLKFSSDTKSVPELYIVLGETFKKSMETVIKEKFPWPGFCQNCFAPLDPPNSTTCHSCGKSDVD